MILFTGLLLTLVFLAMLQHRVTQAIVNQNITGLLYNPLLYLFGGGWAYLVLGTLLAPTGQRLIGFVFYADASDMASWLCYYAFGVITVFYFFSRDRVLSYVPFQLGIVGELAILLLLICLPYAYFTLIKYGPGLFLLHESRYEAMKYYADTFATQGQYGQMYCVTIAVCLIYKLRFPQDWKTDVLFLVGTLPFLATDYLQNARGTILGVFVLYFILYCSRKQKLYITPILMIFGGLLLFGLMLRTDYQNTSLGDNFVSAFSEFFLTRSSVDYVIGNHTDMGLFHLFSASLDRIVPGLEKAIDGSGTLYFTDYVEKTMGLSFGLAGNIVSESYYYGGLGFALASPVIIGAIYAAIARSNAICFLPGFLLNIFLISSTQMFIRNGFYSGFATVVGVMLIHLSFITFLGQRIRILESDAPLEEEADDEEENHAKA